MEKEVALIGERKPLDQLLVELLPLQKTYLSMRALGLGKEYAGKVAGAGYERRKNWNGPLYKLAEAYIEAYDYTDEAKIYITKALAPKALIALDSLVDRAIDWDAQPPHTKPYLMRAIELALKLGEATGIVKSGSYEEMVLKLRRVIRDD